MPSPTTPASLPDQLADAEGTPLPDRLRIIADGDLRTMARDSLMGIHPDQYDLHGWADLMNEAADALTAAESAREAALARAERAERALRIAEGCTPPDDTPRQSEWTYVAMTWAEIDAIRAALTQPAPAEDEKP